MEKLLAISSHGIIKRNLTVYRYINQILKNNQFHAAFYFAMKTGWWLGYISYDFVRRSLRLVFKNGLCLNHYSGPNNMKMNWDLTPGRIEC